nr:molybdopterin-dependent oxidoreductase [Mycobacterium lepromatosis]
MIVAAHVHIIKTYGLDRVVGFSPIPTMSLVNLVTGSRCVELIGDVITFSTASKQTCWWLSSGYLATRPTSPNLEIVGKLRIWSCVPLMSRSLVCPKHTLDG